MAERRRSRTTPVVQVMVLCATALAAGEEPSVTVDTAAAAPAAWDSPATPQPLQSGRHFGDHYPWYSFDDGLRVAEAHAKPVLPCARIIFRFGSPHRASCLLSLKRSPPRLLLNPEPLILSLSNS